MMYFRVENPSPVLVVFMVAVWVAWVSWAVYAAACILNHAGVWPFSYLGAG